MIEDRTAVITCVAENPTVKILNMVFLCYVEVFATSEVETGGYFSRECLQLTVPKCPTCESDRLLET